MSQFSIILIILLAIYFAFMILSFNFRKIERLFTLTSTKEMATKESWEKLNKIWVVGEADISTFDWHDGKHFTVRVAFKEADGARASKSFDGNDVNAVVREGYAWSVERGYIKEGK